MPNYILIATRQGIAYFDRKEETMQKQIEFERLSQADLVVDALYEGGPFGNVKDDPLNPLLSCGNQGGFRPKGSLENPSFIVLYSSNVDPDWPDFLDLQTGRFIYYGDNKKPGHSLHDTSKNGNLILKRSFDALHSGQRDKVPPFFIFTKGVKGRDVIFRGLAVPGAKGLSTAEDLVAIWKSKDGSRFQNYKATFTILDIPIISRNWISDLISGFSMTTNAPDAWVDWIEKGLYTPLIAEKSIEYRNKNEQLPLSKEDEQIINLIYEYFDDPYDFEACAAELFRLMDQNVISYDLTRPWSDGGRDAIGKYRIGLEETAVEVDFALEAKRYSMNNSVGVKETSRLISRIKHRQFGVLITTSYVHLQAYQEIKEDGHPVILICARDIVKILKQAGYTTLDTVKHWLHANFPKRNL